MGFIKKITKKNRGQSFVELSLVFLTLCIIILGVVELGFLLNQYLELQDVVREIARYSSSGDPWHDPDFFTKVEAEYNTVMSRTHLSLHPADGDAITISFYQVNGGSVTKLDGGADHYLIGHHDSTFSVSDIEKSIDPTAPMSGIVVVEGFYRYHQLLGAPIIINFLPDPINVETYSMMPMSAAEPNIP
jgi:hypothetical protein